MKNNFVKGETYLCAIGVVGHEIFFREINEYLVGVWTGDCFSFNNNGPYQNTKLNFRKKIGGNCSTVLRVKLIKDIDF